MPLSCHEAVNKLSEQTDLTIALAGNPNVGKSVIFNRLTGLGVVTANYPGKTVELNIATTHHHDLTLGVIDLPGTYALGAVSEDQWVARRSLLDSRPDAVVYIVDATNLQRNLYMLLQLLDLELPVVVSLNLMDQAEKHGFTIDHERLSEILGVPVVPTVGIRGEGLDEILHAAVEVGQKKEHGQFHPAFGKDVEDRITKLMRSIEGGLRTPAPTPAVRATAATASASAITPESVPPRALAILLLEQDAEFVEATRALPGGPEILAEAGRLGAEMEAEHGEPSYIRITRERHGVAGTIAEEVQVSTRPELPLSQRLWNMTIAPRTGIPILVGVLIATFALLFFVGNWLSTLFGTFWAAFVSPPIKAVVFGIFGHTVLARTLLWGVDAGIEAALSVGIPFVLTFYLLLAVLEDTGYLNSMAFLTDTLAHRLGLHGRAIIPLVAGAGCNVPAIIGTRVLTSMRERVIASTLIVLIPCSARTAVIVGGLSKFAGWQWAAAVFVIEIILIGGVGWGLNRLMPGESSGLVMEMFPLRMPAVGTIAKKTWHRMKDFVFVAFPIVLVGSLVLGGLYETKTIWYLVRPLSPLVEGWLGLPAVAGLTLVFAILRKELALQLLLSLAIVQYGPAANNLLHFMNARQLFVYTLVNTIYIPCAATIAVLGRELGWKRSAGIIAFSIALALAVGGIANQVILLFGGK